MSAGTNDTTVDAIRAQVDEVDRNIVAALAQRHALVDRIAHRKRQLGLAIRDVAREQQILDDRVLRAQELGLPAAAVESLFRLLLLASRSQQARMRVQRPNQGTAKRVAIIGALGGMGRQLVGLFSDLGHRVLPADLDTPLSPLDAARQADVVVLSVPIRRVDQVSAQLGPVVAEDGLLMDVTSLKAAPLAAMMRCCRASVVGTHPMFGPGVATLAGQRVVLCRGRGDRWHEWVRAVFEAHGLTVVESSADHHDRMMGVVQVLVHFWKQVLGLTLVDLGVPLAQALPFTSPSYLLETYVTARHFAQSAELYAAIEMLNPERDRVLEAFLSAARRLDAVVRREDQAAFATIFAEVGEFFGEFGSEALKRSQALIDRVIELSAGEAEG